MVTCHMFLVMTAYVMLSNCLFEGLKPKLKKIKNWKLNKPKGLKVMKEDQRSMGLMVNRLDGR